MTSTNNNTSISAQVDERKKKWNGDIYSFDVYANKDKYQDYGFNSVEDYMASYNNDMDYVTRFDTATLAKQEAETAAKKAESQQLQYADTRRQLMEKYIPETLLAQGVANTGYTADALLKAENNYNQYATNAMNTRAETEQNILKDYQTTLKNMQKDYADTAYKNFLEQNERESASAVDTSNGSNYIVKNPQLSWDAVTQYLKTQGYSDETINGLKPMYDTSRNDYLVTQIDTYISNNPKKTKDEVIAYFEGLGANETTISKVVESYDSLHSQAEENEKMSISDYVADNGDMSWDDIVAELQRVGYTQDEIEAHKPTYNSKRNIYLKAGIADYIAQNMGKSEEEILSYFTNMGATGDSFATYVNEKYSEVHGAAAESEAKKAEAERRAAIDSAIQQIKNADVNTSWSTFAYQFNQFEGDEEALAELNAEFQKKLSTAASNTLKTATVDSELTYDEYMEYLRNLGANDETLAKVDGYFKEYQNKNYNKLDAALGSYSADEIAILKDEGKISTIQAAALTASKNSFPHLDVPISIGSGASPTSAVYYDTGFWDNGFRPSVNGDEFTVKFDGKDYKVKHWGSAGDKISEFAKKYIEENAIFVYDGELYIRYGDRAFEVGGKEYDTLKEKIMSTLIDKYTTKNKISYDTQSASIVVSETGKPGAAGADLFSFHTPYVGGEEEAKRATDMVKVYSNDDSAVKSLKAQYKPGEVFMVGDDVFISTEGGIMQVLDKEAINFVKHVSGNW